MEHSNHKRDGRRFGDRDRECVWRSAVSGKYSKSVLEGFPDGCDPRTC